MNSRLTNWFYILIVAVLYGAAYSVPLGKAQRYSQETTWKPIRITVLPTDVYYGYVLVRKTFGEGTCQVFEGHLETEVRNSCWKAVTAEALSHFIEFHFQGTFQLQRATSNALNFLTNAIFVHRLLYPIQLSKSDPCLQQRAVPDLTEANFSKGIENTDLVIILDSSDQSSCGDDTPTLAHATPCELHPVTNRPIKGLVVICSGKVEQQGMNLDGTSSTLVHEMMHILVFSPEFLFERFYREGGKSKIKNATTLVKRGWKYGGKGFKYVFRRVVDTPKVVKAVREYTGCADLEGAELENGGSAGTSNSHWEKRIFGPELMTGTQSPLSPFSAVTAALLEDSGWYKVDSSYVDELSWGKGLGCKFARESCREYMDRKPDRVDAAYPYCNFRDYVTEESNRLSMLRCGSKRHYVRTCIFKNNKTIAKEYKVFYGKNEILSDGRKVSGEHIIGDDELTDYCPMWKINQRGIDKKRESDDELDNYAMEVFGTSSKCFEQENLFVKLSCVGPRLFGRVDYAYEKAFGAGCYDYKCENGRLHVRAAGLNGTAASRAFKICWAKGSTILLFRYQKDIKGSVNLHRGTILCPSCQEICEEKGNDFLCAPEVEGISSTDPLVSPCYSKAFTVRAPKCLLLLIVVLARYS